MFVFLFSQILVDQINSLKKASESRLEALKKEVVEGEIEFEAERNKASSIGLQSSKEKKKTFTEKQSELRQIKEKTEAIEQLEQRVVAGLAHISDILFIPKSEDDAPVLNLVRDIEAVLDTLINEREKQVQQQQGQSQTGASRENTAVSCFALSTLYNILIFVCFSFPRLTLIVPLSWISSLPSTKHPRSDCLSACPPDPVARLCALVTRAAHTRSSSTRRRLSLQWPRLMTMTRTRMARGTEAL